MSEPLGVIRASSWGDLFDCALRWYYKNIEGMRLPSSPTALCGTAIHAGTARFDLATLERRPIKAADAVEVAYDVAMNPTEEIRWSSEDDDEALGRAESVDFAVKLTSKYCLEIAPAMTYRAVEIVCTKLDLETDLGVVRVRGTVDRVAVDPLRTEGITDFKSGKNAVGTDGVAKTKGHQMQLGIYTLMAEHETKREMGAAQVMGFQTNSKLRIGLGVIKQPKLALVGTHDKPGLIEIAAGMLKSGVFPPNPKSILCSKKWCPAWDVCIYHE